MTLKGSKGPDEWLDGKVTVAVADPKGWWKTASFLKAKFNCTSPWFVDGEDLWMAFGQSRSLRAWIISLIISISGIQSETNMLNVSSKASQSWLALVSTYSIKCMIDRQAFSFRDCSSFDNPRSCAYVFKASCGSFAICSRARSLWVQSARFKLGKYLISWTVRSIWI